MDGNADTILNLDEMLAGYDHEEATSRFGNPEQALEVAKTTARSLANYLDYSGIFEGLDQAKLDVIIDAVVDIEATVATVGLLGLIGHPHGPLLRRLQARAEEADDESGQASTPATDDTAAVQSAEGGPAADAGDSPR